MEKGESSGLPAGGEDYSQATQKLVAFLTSFEEDGLDDVERKYVTKLQEVANRLTRIVEVYLDDVEANLGDEMAERIERNAHRYKQLFADAIDSYDRGLKLVSDNASMGRPSAGIALQACKC